MRKEKSLTRLLRRLVDLLSEEADRNPEFAAKLDNLLASVPSKGGSNRKRGMPKAELDLPDIYVEWRSRGEEEFRFWLRDQPVPVLRALIRKHDLDPVRRTARWKDAEKLGAHIADHLQSRLARGSSFMRGGKNAD